MSVQPETLARATAEERARVVGTSSYEVELDLSRGGDRFGFEIKLEFQGAVPGARSFLDADLSRVDEIEWNDKPLPLTAYQGQRIFLPELGQRNSVRVRGEGNYHRGGLGIHLSTDPADGATYIYTDLEPFEAHRVFPCFDQPDLKGTFRFRIRVPQDWVVVGPESGRPEAVDASDGCRWWSFPTTMALSAYVIGIAAGPFHEVHAQHGRIPLGLYCARSLAQYLDADSIFELTRQGLDYYERVFRIPYPFAKYDQVFCPEKVNGAMESPGCVTITDSVLWRGRPTERQRSDRADLVLHEMAHMWFGDLVTMTWWDDLWLNESFATLMAAFAVDHATAFLDSWVAFAVLDKPRARKQDQLSTSHPVVSEVLDVDMVQNNFDPITYQKGAASLRQLVAWVGEDNFFSALRFHLNQHREANATLQDLVSALQVASGKDVAGWAKAWLSTVGINTLRCELESQDQLAGRPITRATLLQTASESQPLLRPHRIRLGLFDWVDQGLERVNQVELELDGAETPVDQLTGLSRPALLLPNDDDLTYAKIRLDPVSMETAMLHLGAIRDPLARALVWDSTFDLVCDTGLPAHRYARLVVLQLAAETDSTLITTVLARAREATRRYGAPRRAAGLETQLAELAWEGLVRALPGSDQQSVWLRAFASLATSPGQVDRCRAFLEGGGLPDGIVLDCELRWLLVHSLAARGAADEADIATIRELDPSSLGRVRAAAALTARPTPEAKAQAWSRLRAADTTLEEARYIAVSLGGVRREDLLAPYVKRLAPTLDDLMLTRGTEYTFELCWWLPGSFPPSPDLVKACRENLSRPDLHPQLRRTFTSLLEEAEQLLRGRALDESDPS
jgi:aminopeptidase N